jgi:hypothetical protein
METEVTENGICSDGREDTTEGSIDNMPKLNTEPDPFWVNELADCERKRAEGKPVDDEWIERVRTWLEASKDPHAKWRQKKVDKFDKIVSAQDSGRFCHCGALATAMAHIMPPDLNNEILIRACRRCHPGASELLDRARKGEAINYEHLMYTLDKEEEQAYKTSHHSH